MNRRQEILAAAAALALIVWGALFLIAPIWQLGYSTAAYAPPAVQSAAETPRPPSEPVNVNTAGLDELMTLSGIGEAKARAILDDRAANGPYAAPEDLARVKGISERMVAQWGDAVTVG